MAKDFSLIAPELVLTVGALLVLMLAAFAGDKASRVGNWLAVATLVAASVAICAFVGEGGTAFAGTYQADAFSNFSKYLIYGASAVSVLAAPRFFERSGPMRAEYAALILLATVGMSIMVSATDLVSLYIGLELNSLAAYVLASFMRSDDRSTEAGLKYFVLGALASGILLYGVSLLYGFAGTTDFVGIATAFEGETNAGLLFGLVFVIAGLCFKVSAVPFHMWTPDVYEGAPTPVTAFFASAPKVAGMALLTRVVIEALGPGKFDWQQILIFIALASTILGAVAAVRQTNIKRLLAYSSINNVGFALIGLAAGNEAGVAAVLTYMVVYVITTLGSFLCVLQMRDKDGNYVEDIKSLAGLSKTRPALAAAFGIFMFSLAGIPPLFGFWPKLLVFNAAVSAGLMPLAVIGVLSSVIGAFYYINIVKIIYFDAPEAEFAKHDNWIEKGLIAVSAAAMTFVGYLAIPALAASSGAAAQALF